MAEVELIDFTGAGRPDEDWHAANLLLLTKDTRLTHGGSLEAIQKMSAEEKRKEISAMAATIPSSWEFVSLTFRVSGVSRACAQQMTRTRTGSYAMQSLRVVDASGIGVVNPFEGRDPELFIDFENAVYRAKVDYNSLLASGANKEDARAILPLNTETTLIAAYNLRAFVDLVRSRESLRTQGEYRDIIEKMKKACVMAWPWAAEFFIPSAQKAIELLQEVIGEIGMTVGSGPGWKIAKAIDLLRR